MIHVYAIPDDGSSSFLMFIADCGEFEIRAHRNVCKTHRFYEQKIAEYEFRYENGKTVRFPVLSEQYIQPE